MSNPFEGLDPDSFLRIATEITALEEDPSAYLAYATKKIIAICQAESDKPVAERDYDRAWMFTVRSLLAMHVMIKELQDDK